MLCALMDRAWAIKELVELCVVVALSTRLLNGGNEVLWSATSEPSYPGGLLSIMMITVVEVTLAVVIAVVSIIAASFIMAFVVAMWWTIGPGHLGDIFTVTQVSLLSVSILFGGCGHLAD